MTMGMMNATMQYRLVPLMSFLILVLSAAPYGGSIKSGLVSALAASPASSSKPTLVVG